MVLVDTSIWIDYFKGGSASKYLTNLLDEDLIETHEIVLTEIIPILNLRGQKQLVQLLYDLPKRDSYISWDGIRSLQTLNLENGLNKVGIPDLILAQHCFQTNLFIWSLDKHFKIMTDFTTLKLFEL